MGGWIQIHKIFQPFTWEKWKINWCHPATLPLFFIYQKEFPPKNMLKLVGVAQQSTKKFKWLEYVCMTWQRTDVLLQHDGSIQEQSFVSSSPDSSAVALVKQCRSKVKLLAPGCFLTSSRGRILIPFGYCSIFYQWKKNVRERKQQSEEPEQHIHTLFALVFVLKPLGDFLPLRTVRLPVDYINPCSPNASSRVWVNTSTTCHTEITTGRPYDFFKLLLFLSDGGKGGAIKFNLSKLYQTLHLLPSSVRHCIVALHCSIAL